MRKEFLVSLCLAALCGPGFAAHAMAAKGNGVATHTGQTEKSPKARRVPGKATTRHIDWKHFLAQHDMYWTSLSADPVGISSDGGLRTGYYAGALMGNGLLGTNFYKLTDNVYRLNIGRSDVTEVRKPYNLYNSARLPIGYFTLKTVGNVTDETMRLSLYDAITRGTFRTDCGQIAFRTYVHANKNIVVFETEATAGEDGYTWDFVPQQAVSPRQVFRGGAPQDYLNHEHKSNPDPERRQEGDCRLLIQKLATDSSFRTIGKVYVVAWKEQRRGLKRRIVATVSQENTEAAAIASARAAIADGLATSSAALERTHRDWWNNFYRKAAFVSFPDTRFETFYWTQYYKFASTARPGKPIVDLQGVWPTWDTPWTAVWINLNLQLTYSWQTKANLGFLSEPLWEALNRYKENLRRNVTDIPSQSTWTDAACQGRSSSYDFLSPLKPELVASN